VPESELHEFADEHFPEIDIQLRRLIVRSEVDRLEWDQDTFAVEAAAGSREKMTRGHASCIIATIERPRLKLQTSRGA
jgi:hypothetical protein